VLVVSRPRAGLPALAALVNRQEANPATSSKGHGQPITRKRGPQRKTARTRHHSSPKSLGPLSQKLARRCASCCPPHSARHQPSAGRLQMRPGCHRPLGPQQQWHRRDWDNHSHNNCLVDVGGGGPGPKIGGGDEPPPAGLASTFRDSISNMVGRPAALSLVESRLGSRGCVCVSTRRSTTTTFGLLID
jgi:hypothetical protein